MWNNETKLLVLFLCVTTRNGGKYDDKRWMNNKKKRNSIRYVIKVINKSWHCNDTKWTEKMFICSGQKKKQENKVTFVYCSLSCKKATSTNNSMSSTAGRFIYIWDFYCISNKFIALSDIESCSKLNSVFLCSSQRLTWLLLAFWTTMSNKRQPGRWLTFPRKNLTRLCDELRERPKRVRELKGEAPRNLRENMFKLIFYRIIIDFV